MADATPDTSRTIAVIGGTGFIGSRVVRRFLERGDKPVVIVRPDSPRRSAVPAGVEVCEACLDAGDERLAEALRYVNAVVYSAGTVRGARLPEFLPANVQGIAAVAGTLAAVNPGCQLLVLSSLAASQPELSHYARSKRMGERVLEADFPHVPWTILRPTAVYGPGDRELLPLFGLMRRGLVPSLGGAVQRLSFIHVDDLSSAILAVLDNPDAVIRRTYTLDDGTPGGYDRAAMAAGVRPNGRAAFVPVPRFVLMLLARSNLVLSRLLRRSPMLTPGKVGELTHPSWLGDNQPLTDATGWRPRHNLADGVRQSFGD